MTTSSFARSTRRTCRPKVCCWSIPMFLRILSCTCLLHHLLRKQPLKCNLPRTKMRAPEEISLESTAWPLAHKTLYGSWFHRLQVTPTEFFAQTTPEFRLAMEKTSQSAGLDDFASLTNPLPKPPSTPVPTAPNAASILRLNTEGSTQASSNPNAGGEKPREGQ